jgi:hypothetical protein
MGTIQTPECSRIEQAVREEMAPGVEVECRKDFDTKDYIVWLTLRGKSLSARVTSEAYQDNRWKPAIQGVLEELNSN